MLPKKGSRGLCLPQFFDGRRECLAREAFNLLGRGCLERQHNTGLSQSLPLPQPMQVEEGHSLRTGMVFLGKGGALSELHHSARTDTRGFVPGPSLPKLVAERIQGLMSWGTLSLSTAQLSNLPKQP